jgi:hypothetical protein
MNEFIKETVAAHITQIETTIKNFLSLGYQLDDLVLEEHTAPWFLHKEYLKVKKTGEVLATFTLTIEI